MQKRKLSNSLVNPIGLGCMNLSHAYGVPPSVETGREILLKALDLGVDHLDTAALYGFGKNEELVGETLKPYRNKFFLASKCGMQGIDGVRVIDGRPETIKKTLEDSLRRLQTDVIDLYYLHRLDIKGGVPIEDSVGAMADLVKEGKIKAIGLSEMSADTIKRGHAIHPIAAIQTEYSLWTRNAEIAVLKTCQEIGAAFVAFSPVARGFLANGVRTNEFAPKDIRAGMPRFQEPHFSNNLKLLDEFVKLANEAHIKPAQLSLAWCLAQGEHIHVIPGTTSLAHLEENMATTEVSPEIIARADAIINRNTVSGPRYPAGTQIEIDTEEF